MKISARNQINGTVKSISEGAVTTIVEIETAGGDRIVSSITATSAQELALAEGQPVTAVIKASDVLLATD